MSNIIFLMLTMNMGYSMKECVELISTKPKYLVLKRAHEVPLVESHEESFSGFIKIDDILMLMGTEANSKYEFTTTIAGYDQKKLNTQFKIKMDSKGRVISINPVYNTPYFLFSNVTKFFDDSNPFYSIIDSRNGSLIYNANGDKNLSIGSNGAVIVVDKKSNESLIYKNVNDLLSNKLLLSYADKVSNVVVASGGFTIFLYPNLRTDMAEMIHYTNELKIDFKTEVPYQWAFEDLGFISHDGKYINQSVNNGNYFYKELRYLIKRLNVETGGEEIITPDDTFNANSEHHILFRWNQKLSRYEGLSREFHYSFNDSGISYAISKMPHDINHLIKQKSYKAYQKGILMDDLGSVYIVLKDYWNKDRSSVKAAYFELGY